MNNRKNRTRLELATITLFGLILYILLVRFDAAHLFMALVQQYEHMHMFDAVLVLVIFGALFPVVLMRKNAALRREYEAHQQKEEMLYRLAHIDSLTRLGNRLQLNDELPRFQEQARALGSKVTVIKINLDRFKQINDLRGLPAGDVLLTRVADRIQSLCGEEDAVMRTSSDEFVVLTKGTQEQAGDLGQNILNRIRDPFEFETWRGELTASVGMAVWDEGISEEDLLAHADQAMFWAKETGRNCLVEYERSIGEMTRRSAQLRADLIHAVEANAIKPYFQPIVCMTSGRLIGFEALARWHHAENGFVSPEVFIALAEDIGIIDLLTDKLFERCCREMQNWPKTLRLSFNLSPVQLSEHAQSTAGQLAERLRERLDKAGIDARRIDLEITERAVISDIDSARRVIGELRALGMRISLDDFGTGTSSLSILSQLPFNTIKIDRSFVTDITNRPDLAKIVRSVLFLANSMGVDVTAEGIETPAELRFLREHDCDKGQGYLLGRPMASDQLAPILAWDGAVWNVGQSGDVRAAS